MSPWFVFLARSSPYLSLFAIDFAAGAVNPLLPYLTATRDEFADVSAAGAAAVALGNIASGYLAGVLPVRWIMTVWLLIAAAANAGTAIAPSFGILMLCRVAANVVDNWSLTQTLIDPRGSSAAVTGRATAAVLGGRVFGGVLGGLTTHGIGPQGTCFLCAGVLVVVAVLDAVVIPQRTADAQKLLEAVAEDEDRESGPAGLADEGALLPAAGDDDDDADADVGRLLDGGDGAATLSPALPTGPKQAGSRAATAVGKAEDEEEATGTPGGASSPGGIAASESAPLTATARLAARDTTEREADWAELRRLLAVSAASPGLWAHTAVLVANGLACGALNTTVPSALKDRFGTTPEFVQYTQAADTALRSFASAVLLPLLAVAVREPWRSGLLAIALVGGLGLVLAFQSPLWPFVVVNAVAFALQSVHQSAALAGMNAYLVSSARQLRAVVKGYAFAVFVGGISLGSYAAERVLQAAGPEALWIPLMALVALCVVLNRVRPFDADKAVLGAMRDSATA